MEIKNLFRLIKFLRHPLKFRNAILYKVASILFRKNNGFYIFDEYWDNMIILDACRYDSFRDFFIKRNIKGKLSKKISRGSHTETFLLENFKKKKYNDIVYITANPYVNLTLKNKFFIVISVWKDGWNHEHHTVLPETIYDYVIDALIQYPNKKLIIHFMQPHPPFINSNIEYNSLENMRALVISSKKYVVQQEFKRSLFKWVGDGIYSKFDKKTIIKVYRNNLEIAIPYVEKLIEILPGITIVTADHGEALGENLHTLIPIKFYGHMRRIRMPSIVEVPWLSIKPKEKDPSVYQDLTKRKELVKSISDLKEKGFL